MSLAFGTDGVRGRAGTPPIDVDTARRLGAWAGATVGRVLVVRDTRPSGRELAEALIEGVVSAGGHALDGGVAPTSAAAIGVDSGWADGAWVATASHNAAVDNGFKWLGQRGRKPSDEAAAAIVAGATTGRPSAALRGTRQDVSARLAERWAEVVDGVSGAVAGPVALDLAHGAASTVIGALQSRRQGLHVVVGGGAGEINDGVGSEHPGRLASAMASGGFRGGIAVDGDANRSVLVDEIGRVVSGDALLGWLAASQSAAGLAVTVMSSLRLEAALPGVEIVRTPVGDRHVRAAMDAQGLELGGEESGHVLFADVAGGDGLLAGLAALSAAGDRPLSACVAPFAPWPRRAGKVASAERRPLPHLADYGPRLGGGRVFVRWSGTEPILRWLVEAPEADAVDAVAAEVAEHLARWVG